MFSPNVVPASCSCLGWNELWGAAHCQPIAAAPASHHAPTQFWIQGSWYVRCGVGKPLTDLELENEMGIFLFAGFETTGGSG